MRPRTAALRSAAVTLPAVALNATVQSATVLPPSAPTPLAVFVALVVVSAGSLTVALAFSLAAIARATRAPHTRFGLPTALMWSTAGGIVLAAALAAVASPYLVPFALLGGAILAGAVAARRANPWSGFRVFLAHPARAIGLAVLTLVVVGVVWLAALLLGFFVAGVAAAALLWLLAGLAALALLSAWTGLVLRTAPAADRRPDLSTSAGPG